MAENSKIEWTDHTFNPWIGCTAISPACDHCYAKTLVERWGCDFSERRRTAEANWHKPFVWNRNAEHAGKRIKVFCASLADVFDNQVPEEWRADLWKLIRITPWLDWQLLTKRPQNIVKMLPADWGDGWPNVWLGTTAEDQHHYDQRWPHMEAVPARIRFVSYEPALGQVDFRLFKYKSPDWVICGGESGRGARPMHPCWVAEAQRQCEVWNVPFFFKQWGEWEPRKEWVCAPRTQMIAIKPDGSMVGDDDVPEDVGGHRMARVGKGSSGALLHGAEHKEFPA